MLCEGGTKNMAIKSLMNYNKLSGKYIIVTKREKNKCSFLSVIKKFLIDLTT